MSNFCDAICVLFVPERNATFTMENLGSFSFHAVQYAAKRMLEGGTVKMKPGVDAAHAQYSYAEIAAKAGTG